MNVLLQGTGVNAIPTYEPNKLEGNNIKFEEKIPPPVLYHGTAERNLDSILEKGLEKRARHHVHLSAEIATATNVGARHGKPVVLNIRAGDMHRAGHAFFRSTNGVWLVDAVPLKFIQFPNTL